MFPFSLDAVKNAVTGKQNTWRGPDYLGEDCIWAYEPLEVKGLDWILITKIDSEEAFSRVSEYVKTYWITTSIFLTLLILVIIFIFMWITRPLIKLFKGAKELQKGNLDHVIRINSKDEIGLLASVLNKGIATIKENQDIILRKNEILENQRKTISDSIQYASLIRSSALPSLEKLKAAFGDIFVFYSPRDVVSGDFYWLGDTKTHSILSAIDCTGHGVPGALLTMKANSILYRLVEERKIVDPAEILKHMDNNIIYELKQKEKNNSDGMDMGIFSIDKESGEAFFAGANNILLQIKPNGELIETKGDRFPVGSFHTLINEKVFQNHRINLEKDDCLYLYSDGIIDQFGGLRGKKLKRSPFRKYLQEISHLKMEDQGNEIGSFFEKWLNPGNGVSFQQIDDVLVIGFRVE
jgi:serine phosphatase RsbU (regulator of sigma subunit)